MSYFVVGGEYRDTTFRELVRPDPVEGPFPDYESAFVHWRAKAMATIDVANVRYRIVQANEAREAEAAIGVNAA
jgi:hypothetical protein